MAAGHRDFAFFASRHIGKICQGNARDFPCVRQPEDNDFPLRSLHPRKPKREIQIRRKRINSIIRKFSGINE